MALLESSKEVAKGLQTSLSNAYDRLKKASGSLSGISKRDNASPAADEHLQSALDRSRNTLESASTLSGVQQWLMPRLNTSKGTEEVYNLLEDHVNQPEFLKQLEDAKEGPQEPAAHPHGDEVLHEEWWEPPKGAASQDAESDDGYLEVTKEEMLDAEPLESYVLVRKEDVLEAIGAFVAAYLAELPEAQNLQPAQLQAALKTTFKELRKGRVRRLWEWGRMLYRITAFSYGAFSVYENPWLVRAVLAALWTACRMLVGSGVKALM